MPLKSIHAFYSGYVQGVGFRYTVRRIALGMDISGWVRNLPDGKVEALCEGEEQSLKDFIDRVSGEFPSSRVENTQISRGDATGKFNGFEIRF